MSDRLRLLVTGASGFLGTAIVAKAVEAGHVVRGLSRRKPSTASIEWSVADICEPSQLAPAMRGVDCVIHTAGAAHIFWPTPSDAARMHAINAEGARNVARAAAEAGVRRMVAVSSIKVYGSAHSGPRDEQVACHPDSAYGRTKHQGELWSLEEGERTGMEVVALRMTALYGPGDAGNMSRMIRMVDRGRWIWIGAGKNRKSFTHVSDAADACLLSALTPGLAGPFNVAVEHRSVREMVAGICQALGVRMPALRVPRGLALGGARAVAALSFINPKLGALVTQIENLTADDLYPGSSFAGATGFAGQVPFQTGISQEVGWYRTCRS